MIDPPVVFASLLGLSLALLTTGLYSYYSEPRIRRTEGVVVLNPDNVSTDKISFRPPEKLKQITNTLEQELRIKLKKDRQRKAVLLIKLATIGVIVSIAGLLIAG